MRQRLDIADVEARTKIRAKYLRALENEEFAMLPGSTFVRTFLRTYAEVLGLDPQRLVEEYRTNYEPRDDLDVQPIAPGAGGGGGGPGRGRERGGRQRPRPSGPRNPLPIIGGAVIVILIFLIVLGLTAGNDNDNSGKQSAKTETTKTTPKKRKPKPATPTTVTLRVEPDGPTYVCLDRGPGTDHLFEGTISEPQTFKGQKLRINLGRTAGQLILNGKKFNVEPSATPVGYEFSPTGSKPIPPQERPCVAQ
jgi:cytoskeletal protein RodZ